MRARALAHRRRGDGDAGGPIVDITGACTCCGKCCEEIWLTCSPEDAREQAKDSGGERLEDYSFIIDHWHHEDSKTIQSVATTEDSRSSEIELTYYKYRCDQYDSRRKLCGAQDSKPPICRHFPHYADYAAAQERDPTDVLIASLDKLPECSYWYDVPRDRWPSHAKPRIPLPMFRRDVSEHTDDRKDAGLGGIVR